MASPTAIITIPSLFQHRPFSHDRRYFRMSYDGPAFEKAINDIPESHRIRELFSRSTRVVPPFSAKAFFMGWNIGCIIISEWAEFYQLGDETRVENFYNIEDGQTRIDAFVRFKNGEFSTKFGDYESVKRDLIHINLLCVYKKKAHSRYQIKFIIVNF